jgi:hypothetical protein
VHFRVSCMQADMMLTASAFTLENLLYSTASIVKRRGVLMHIVDIKEFILTCIST